jgi:hypothetical protein
LKKCTCNKSQIFCDAHVYQSKFTEEELKQIQEKTDTFKQCKVGCGKWEREHFDGTKCNECKERNKANREKRNQMKNTCCVMEKPDKDSKSKKCTCEVVTRNSVYPDCKTKDKKYPFQDILNNFNIENENFIKLLEMNNIFCAMHLKTYIEEMYENNKLYTKEDVAKFEWCSTCKKYYHLDDFDGCKTCFTCRGISKENRKIFKENPTFPPSHIHLNLNNIQSCNFLLCRF